MNANTLGVINGLLKVVLSFLGGIAVAKGWLSTDNVGTLSADVMATVGPLAALGAASWSAFHHATTVAVPNAVAKAAGVVPGQ